MSAAVCPSVCFSTPPDHMLWFSVIEQDTKPKLPLMVCSNTGDVYVSKCKAPWKALYNKNA